MRNEVISQGSYEQVGVKRRNYPESRIAGCEIIWHDPSRFETVARSPACETFRLPMCKEQDKPDEDESEEADTKRLCPRHVRKCRHLRQSYV